MRFNYVKGFVSSALFLSLYVNAYKYNGEGSTLRVSRSSKEGRMGYISEVDMITNARIEGGAFSDLNELERFSIDINEKSIEQCLMNELSTLINLTDLQVKLTKGYRYNF